MNRRSFLTHLAVGVVAAPAIAKALAKPQSQRFLLADWSDCEMLKTPWLQTTRVNSYCSIAYLDAVDEITGMPEPERRLAWHARRKDRARENLAILRMEPAHQLP